MASGEAANETNRLTMNRLDTLIAAVRSAGFYATTRPSSEYPISAICAKTEPKPEIGGLSFWVTFLKGNWYLASWGYRYWRIPREHSAAEVCIEYLTTGTNLGAPPSDLRARFGLVEVELEEFTELGRAGES